MSASRLPLRHYPAGLAPVPVVAQGRWCSRPLLRHYPGGLAPVPVVAQGAGVRAGALGWVVRLLLAVAAVTVVGVVPVGTAAPAQAAAYRYWTSWWGAPAATSWTFASTGPAFHVPKDGAVEGWRFAVSTQAGGQQPAEGRSPASVFEELCAGTAAEPGRKRVALLLDSGSSADAPDGQDAPSPRLWGRCLSLPPGATGAAVLTAAGVSARTDRSGLICALNGYPRGECAPVVADPSPTTPRPTSPRPTSPRPTTAKPSASPSSASPTVATTTSPTTGAPATSATTAAPRTSGASGSPTPAAGSGASTSAPPAAAGGSGQGPTEDVGAAPIATGIPAPGAPGDEGGTPWTLLAGLVVVAGLGTAAVLRMRGSR